MEARLLKLWGLQWNVQDFVIMELRSVQAAWGRMVRALGKLLRVTVVQVSGVGLLLISWADVREMAMDRIAARGGFDGGSCGAYHDDGHFEDHDDGYNSWDRR